MNERGRPSRWTTPLQEPCPWRQPGGWEGHTLQGISQCGSRTPASEFPRALADGADRREPGNLYFKMLLGDSDGRV